MPKLTKKDKEEVRVGRILFKDRMEEYESCGREKLEEMYKSGELKLGDLYWIAWRQGHSIAWTSASQHGYADGYNKGYAKGHEDGSLGFTESSNPKISELPVVNRFFDGVM